MRLGTWGGVKVSVNPFFLGLIALFLVAGVLEKGLLAFVVVLFHEFCHTLVAQKMGIRVQEVELLPFGGVTKMKDEPALEPSKEFWIALAGPLSNLFLCFAVLGLRNYGFWQDDLGSFFLQINIFIALFNFLPALPLDGGRVYRSILARKLGLKKASFKAAKLGQFFGIIIIILGGVGFFLGYLGLDILLTGAFLYYAATKEKIAAPYLFIKHILKKEAEIKGEKLLPVFTWVALENMLLGEIIQVFLPQRFHIIIILDQGMNYKGLVLEDTLVNALSIYGYDYPVGKLIGEV